jgi:hypothetical protein
MHFFHKHGGVIESIRAIEHSTYEGVAEWEFRGRVKWSDGGISEDAHIAPWAVCCDSAVDEQLKAWNDLTRKLNDYLDRNGTWHEPPIHHVTNRIIHWVPHQPEGCEAL